jgi:hypothetical protein
MGWGGGRALIEPVFEEIMERVLFEQELWYRISRGLYTSRGPKQGYRIWSEIKSDDFYDDYDIEAP